MDHNHDGNLVVAPELGVSEVRDPILVQEGRNVPGEGTESENFENDVASEVSGDDEFVPAIEPDLLVVESRGVSPGRIGGHSRFGGGILSASVCDEDSASFSPRPIPQCCEVGTRGSQWVQQ